MSFDMLVEGFTECKIRVGLPFEGPIKGIMGPQGRSSDLAVDDEHADARGDGTDGRGRRRHAVVIHSWHSVARRISLPASGPLQTSGWIVLESLRYAARAVSCVTGGRRPRRANAVA